MGDELEQRLRDSLRAYAGLVDAPADRLPAPRARPAVRRWRGVVLGAAAAAAVVTGSLWVVAGRDPGPAAVSAVSAGESSTPAPDPGGDSGTASDQALSGTAAPAEGFRLPPSLAPGVAYPVDLSTHCGVRGIDIGGVWFAAEPPLVGEGGNPPAGWGDPDQRGTVTLLSGTEAVFADDAGHQVRLRADESARPAPCD